VVLTRQIGPAEYGRYVGGLAIVVFLTAIARLGVDTYLIRRPVEPSRAECQALFTLMAVNGLGVAIVGVLVAPVVLGPLIGEPFVRPFQAMVCAVPLSLLLAPGLALLERHLRYRRVAFIELGNNLTFYGVAVPLVVVYPSVAAPVIAYLVAQGVTLLSTLVASRFPVGLSWSRTEIAAAARYGAPLTLASAATDGRLLVNPIIVGGLLGPAAVGYVGLAVRVTDMLRFVGHAGYRVSVAAFARVRNEPPRLSRAVSEGMFLQFLAVAPFYAGFAVLSPLVVPLALGQEWNETVEVFPLVAAAGLITAEMSLQASLLYVVGRGHAVLASAAAGLGILALGAAAAIRLLDSSVGYGVGEVLSVSAFVILHHAAGRYVDVGYRRLTAWNLAAVTVFAWPWVPLPWAGLLLVPIFTLLIQPKGRSEATMYLRYLLPRGSGEK
jgi:PST family polysaccharide transporter